MEDLSRFSGKIGGSSRLAAYRAGLNGKSAASIGLANALARASGKPEPLAARTVPTSRNAMATKPKASTAPHDRVKFVAHAVATDPACKGKAALAIQMLADPDYANVSGAGVVKLLKAGATATVPTAKDAAAARDKAQRQVMRAAIIETGNSGIAPEGGSGAKSANSGGSWSRVIADMNARNGFKADTGGAEGSSTGGSWARAIADMNRRNGFQ